MIETAVPTKDLILDAADRMMARWGFRKMTMDDLAREAGVSRRTIYVYFRSKQEVGLSSIGRVVENVHSELESILASDLPSSAKLRKMLVRRVMGRIEQIADYYHSLDELFEVVRPAYMARRKDFFDREIDLIAQAIRRGGFLVDSPSRSAETMMLATNAFLPYSLSIRELGAPKDICQRLESMVDLLIAGLETGQGA